LAVGHIGTMLLAHPERLQCFDDPWIDCVGDGYRIPDTLAKHLSLSGFIERNIHGRYNRVITFRHNTRKIIIASRHIKEVWERFSAPSAYFF
jgi:hypothetical protein